MQILRSDPVLADTERGRARPVSRPGPPSQPILDTGNLNVVVARKVADTARRVTFIRERLPLNASLLDVGSGYGVLLGELARSGYCVTGVEPGAARRAVSCQIARLTRVIATRRIPVVTAIGWLYSLTYSLRKLETVFGVYRDCWGTFREQIADFRRHYFSDPERVDARLVSLVIEGHAVACDALRTFAEHIVKGSAVYGPARAPEGRLTVPGGIVLDFVARPDVPSPRALVTAAVGGTTVVHLPAALARYFAVYGTSDGIIGRRLRMALAPSAAASEASQVATDMREILHERISTCDRWASFLRDNEVQSGLFKFAWFFEHDRSGEDSRRTSR
jgi:SAM-dependent methyltransferase